MPSAYTLSSTPNNVLLAKSEVGRHLSDRLGQTVRPFPVSPMSRPLFTFYTEIRTPSVPQRTLTVEVQAHDITEARNLFKALYPAATFYGVFKK